MEEAGYNLGKDIPTNGDTLIKDLIDRCSYDEIYLTEQQLANASAHVPAEEYQDMFNKLPTTQKDQMEKQWGKAPGIAYVHQNKIALSGLEFGNVFVALQPPRGYGMDPDKIYHTPDLPPPHNYYALYIWLRDVWKADAIVHAGKHGTLEWLPGKGVGLSRNCYPDSFLNDIPLIYPFIINDPGEGTQSKRRAHAIIIDHLTPPMTTADGYGELAQLMQLVDEYYQVEMLDPSKLPLIQRQIWDLIQEIKLGDDLAFLLNHDHDHEYAESSEDQEEDKNAICSIHSENNTQNEHNHKHDHGYDQNEIKDEHQGIHKDDNHTYYHGDKDHDENSHEHIHRNNIDNDEDDHKLITHNQQDHSHINGGNIQRERLQNQESDHGHEHHEHEHDHDHEWESTLNKNGTPSVLAKMKGADFAHLMETMDGYLCELAGAQIRDGLHILGQVPEGDFMVDTLQALTRLPNLDIPSLRHAISKLFGLDSADLLSNLGARLNDIPESLVMLADRPLVTSGDVIETIDELVKHLLALLNRDCFDIKKVSTVIRQTFDGLTNQSEATDLSDVLNFVCKTLVPSLQGTTQEITNLINALNGKFVPAGPSGSPTRVSQLFYQI